MMGKIPKSGKSFKGCVEYCMLKNKAELLYADGVRVGDIKQTIADFNMQRKLNPDLGQAVGHIALNWSPNDILKLTDELMVKIAQEYLYKMKIRDTQVLIVKHTDKEHPHVHIVYNRVGNNGKTISDSMQREHNVKVSKALTLKYGLHISQGKEQVNRQQLKGADKVKYELYDAIKAASQKVRSMDELKQVLQKQGIGMQYKYKSGTREIQGISFNKGEYTFKGSKIDRSLSYGNLSAAIGQRVEQEQARQQSQQSLADQLREVIRENSKTQPPAFTPSPSPHYSGPSFLETLLEQPAFGNQQSMDDALLHRKKRKKKSQSQYIRR